MGWVVNTTPRPLYPRGKDPVPIVQEAGWAPGPVWTGAENLASTGIRSPDRPARSESLYRLSYRGPLLGLDDPIIQVRFPTGATNHSPLLIMLTTLGPTEYPILCTQYDLSAGVKRSVVKPTTHPHVARMLRISGATPSPPYAFMSSNGTTLQLLVLKWLFVSSGTNAMLLCDSAGKDNKITAARLTR